MSMSDQLTEQRTSFHESTPTAATRSWWRPGARLDWRQLPEALRHVTRPLYIIGRDGNYSLAHSGIVLSEVRQVPDDALPLAVWTPPVNPEFLGDITFCRDHAVRFPYMTGAMANGIASVRLVKAITGAGMLGSFGAAGLTLPEIEAALLELDRDLPPDSWCANLIYSPNEQGMEEATVDLYLRHGLKRVEASAYLALTLPLVRYRVHGIHMNEQGEVVTPNRIIAKASRIEVANKWFSPPPPQLLQQLVDRGDITAEQARLAAAVPMAQDLTVEADSGGHTDNRPAITLLPTIMALRDRLQQEHDYAQTLRVGAAGGIATPASAAAAFAMGAAYIVTGTINQACIESGSSDLARRMLADAEQADVAMAPAVDMFEMGVKLQVLKRGTLFAMRGNKLYEYYRKYDAIEAIPAEERRALEQTIFRAPLEEIWQHTRSFFMERDPAQVDRAARDPKHRMALIFRWYLGLSSRWANTGEQARQADYQIWCGPAMGAFNEWTRGSFLQQLSERRVETVALNLMFGAAVITRMNILGSQGFRLPAAAGSVGPLPAEQIGMYLQ